MRLIDGDALQKDFEDLATIQWNKDTCTTCARAFKESAERVEDAKTIDAVERKRGRWIGFDSDTEKYDDVMCSNCKKNFTVDAYRWCDIGFTVDDLKFCPNCGADMRKGEEE